VVEGVGEAGGDLEGVSGKEGCEMVVGRAGRHHIETT